MRIALTALPGIILLLMSQGVAGVYIGEPLDPAELYATGMVKTPYSIGSDPNEKEVSDKLVEIGAGVGRESPDIGSLYGEYTVEVNPIGPQAKAAAMFLANRTGTAILNIWPPAHWEGGSWADGTFYYNFALVPKQTIPIDQYLRMPLRVQASGHLFASQSQLGTAVASAGMEVWAISPTTGNESRLFREWHDLGFYPTGDCLHSLDACASKSDSKDFFIDTTFEVWIAPNAPLPVFQVNGAAHGVAKSATSMRGSDASLQLWGGWGIMSAFIDPLIFIDPTWEYADLFDLEFSPNVVQAVRPIPDDNPEPPSIPEPASLALLASGVVILLWRKS
ncbi:MAG: hypothetical protein ACK2UO_04660 [Caldilineaceae bacterium]